MERANANEGRKNLGNPARDLPERQGKEQSNSSKRGKSGNIVKDNDNKRGEKWLWP